MEALGLGKTIAGICVAILIFFIILIVIGLFIFRGVDTSWNEVHIFKVTLTESENKVAITGEIVFNSTKAFYGYQYSIENGVLLLRIKSGLVNPVHRFSDFRIEIMDEKISTIHSIALKSGKETTSIFRK